MNRKLKKTNFCNSFTKIGSNESSNLKLLILKFLIAILISIISFWLKIFSSLIISYKMQPKLLLMENKFNLNLKILNLVEYRF